MESMRLAKQMAGCKEHRASKEDTRPWYLNCFFLLNESSSEFVYELVLILAAVEHTLLGRLIEFLDLLQR